MASCLSAFAQQSGRLKGVVRTSAGGPAAGVTVVVTNQVTRKVKSAQTNSDGSYSLSLAAGAYSANQSIARLLHEEHFACVYQQGGKFSLLAVNVNEASLLLVIFRAQVGVGAVKFYAGRIRERIARQLRRAHDRDPEAGLDLSKINLAETRSVFQRKA